jgi:hypothetical protein
MELFLYMFKHNILEARPTEKWLRRCRWYAIKEDKSERFKAFLSYLESVFYPRIDLTFKGERYFVIVKAGGIREHYVLICPDIVYDVIISPERIESLEQSGNWRYDKFKFGAVGYAIFLVGVNTKASSKISEVKEKFNQIYEKVKNEIK